MEKIKSTLILCYGFVAVHAPKELVLSRIEADILKNIFQYFNTKVSRRDAPSSLGRAGAGRLLRVLCPNGPAGTCGQPWEKVLYRSLCSLGHCPCLVFQVLGIKVETKVQCEALNLNSSLLFPAVSACLLLWAPLKSSPSLRSQQWSPAPGDLGQPRELLLLTRGSTGRSLLLEPLPGSAKTHSRGKAKMPFWQDRRSR